MQKKLFLSTALLFSFTLFSTTVIAKENITPTFLSNKTIPAMTMEWTELMPEEDLKLIESMQPVNHDSMSKQELAKDKIVNKNSLIPLNTTSKFEAATDTNNKRQKRTWKDALVSTQIRPELNNKKIKLAGYIVPLEYNSKDSVTAFFFVPYFGACIHVPPPPPNQIIYVRNPKGLKLPDLYTPYWTIGTLRIETVTKDNGISAYSLDAESVSEYKEE